MNLAFDDHGVDYGATVANRIRVTFNIMMTSIRNPSTKDALPSACASSSINERGLGLLTDAELDQVTGAGSKPGGGDDEGPGFVPYLITRQDLSVDR